MQVLKWKFESKHLSKQLFPLVTNWQHSICVKSALVFKKNTKKKWLSYCFDYII